MKHKLRYVPIVMLSSVLMLMLPVFAGCRANQTADQTSQSTNQTTTQSPYKATADPAKGWHTRSVDESNTLLLSISKDNDSTDHVFGMFSIYYREGGSRTVEEKIAFTRDNALKSQGGACRDTRFLTIDGHPAQEVTYTQLIGGVETVTSSTFLLVDGVMIEIIGNGQSIEDFKKIEPDIAAMRDSVRIIKR
jgi:hypothetical protein